MTSKVVIPLVSPDSLNNKDSLNNGALNKDKAAFWLEMAQTPLFKGPEAILMGSFWRGLAALDKAATTSLNKDKTVRAHKALHCFPWKSQIVGMLAEDLPLQKQTLAGIPIPLLPKEP